jgi:hypothetical protein
MSRPSRHGQVGLREGSSSRRTPRIPSIQEPDGSRSHSAPAGPFRGNVPPPPNPPAAGGAPDPGDSSSDDDDEGPDPRRDPRGFRKWAKEKASAGVFIKMVKTIMGRDKKKNEESRSTGVRVRIRNHSTETQANWSVSCDNSATSSHWRDDTTSWIWIKSDTRPSC